MPSRVGWVQPLLAIPLWRRPPACSNSGRVPDPRKLTGLRGAPSPDEQAERVFSRPRDRDLYTHAGWRSTWLLAFLLLGGNSGCAPTHPGETFFAGYISPEKQSKVSRVFVVRNTTSDSVGIGSVDRTCTCTSFELGKYRLAPGESTTLSVVVDVTGGFMTRSAACVLRTDHPKFKDWSYSLTFVSAPFAVANPSVLNLGSFEPDGKSFGTVRVFVRKISALCAHLFNELCCSGNGLWYAVIIQLNGRSQQLMAPLADVPAMAARHFRNQSSYV